VAGFGIDLESCDPEIREAFFEALTRHGAGDRHAARMAKLRKAMGR
jgi:hypothetical protein